MACLLPNLVRGLVDRTDENAARELEADVHAQTEKGAPRQG
jgi:hypothetical protein